MSKKSSVKTFRHLDLPWHDPAAVSEAMKAEVIRVNQLISDRWRVLQPFIVKEAETAWDEYQEASRSLHTLIGARSALELLERRDNKVNATLLPKIQKMEQHVRDLQTQLGSYYALKEKYGPWKRKWNG